MLDGRIGAAAIGRLNFLSCRYEPLTPFPGLDRRAESFRTLAHGYCQQILPGERSDRIFLTVSGSGAFALDHR